MSEFAMLPLPKEVITVKSEELNLPKALDFAVTLSAKPSVNLIECLRVGASNDAFFHPNDEIVIFDVPVEVGQQPVNDIRYVERIAVHFDSEDRLTPWVFALREDFPKVSHLNSLPFEIPKSLCTYEIPYDELKIEWRSANFLDRICGWLSLTGTGELHQDSQALEPLLVYNSGTIIIPPDVRPDETLIIYIIASRGNYLSLLASRIDLPDQVRYPSHFLVITGNAQPHGVMGKTPGTLLELNMLLRAAGVDLYGILRKALQDFVGDQAKLSQRLCLFLELPKTGKNRIMNEHDFHAFLSGETMEEIGLELGFFQRTDAGLGNIHFENIDATLGSNLSVLALIPQIQLTPELALLLSGNQKYFNSPEMKFFQIGAGALGSQFFMNQARTGFGKWTITDDDFLLPHNLVRHALDMNFLGNFKSIGIAFVANQLYGSNDFSFALTENFLHPKDPEKLYSYLKDAEIILDVSTSIAVARKLASMDDLSGRRISMFLSPAGRDIVILAEDVNREHKLDLLEFQYYRMITQNEGLGDHLHMETGIRISNSCRDISSRISQEFVAMLAAVGAYQFRTIVVDSEALIGIWRVKEETMEIVFHKAEVTGCDIWEADGWIIFIDHQLLETIRAARIAQLPNETGGILIGGYDLERKRLYVVDTILSPSDSEEYPTAYIRGTQGVEPILANYSIQTADHLKYVGEWHSHPKGCDLGMSTDDGILFAYLFNQMQAINLPAFMIIAGDDKNYQIYIET